MPICRSCWRGAYTGFFLLVLGLGVLGCNVLDGLEPTSASVEDLLADARVAMTNGNAQRAVNLMETAFKKDSTNVEVRVELANALYVVNGIDVFTVRSAVEHLNGKGGETVSGDSDANVCTDGATLPGAAERFLAITFEDEGVQTLAAHAKEIRRASELVIDGVLSRRSEAFSQMSINTRATGYLLASLTRVAQGVLSVRTVVRDTGSSLYVDRETASSGALVACSPTTDDRVRVERSLCRHENGVGQATSWLRRRNDLLSTEQTALLIDLLATHAEALRARLPCPTADTAPMAYTGFERNPVE